MVAATTSKWNEPTDSRDEDGAGVYPNYNIFETKSGHVLMFDDSEGQESVTLQHRSGSMFQMKKDGSVSIRTNGTKYEVTLGDNNVKITGSQNITVDGGGSLHVIGNYDMVVQGDMNMMVQGNMKTAVAGNMETAVMGTQTTAVQGDVKNTYDSNMTTAVDGTYVLQGDGGVAINATNGGLYMSSAESLGVYTDSAMTMNAAGGNINLKSAGNIYMNS